MLCEQGYPVAQGFLFARPLAPKEFEHWLAANPVPTVPGAVAA
jgi:EAL domain-containing protein (putative c-di-GMP-specific phosphodiesterase class I)